MTGQFDVTTTTQIRRLLVSQSHDKIYTQSLLKVTLHLYLSHVTTMLDIQQFYFIAQFVGKIELQLKFN